MRPAADPIELARRFFDERGIEAHVVGGRVRDALLGRATFDTDVVVHCGALDMAREMSRVSGGALVPLDAERGIARVVWSAEGGATRTLDLADMVGPDLAADLRARDFTVNAMAAPVSGHWPPDEQIIVDPCDGKVDLAARTLRMTSAAALDADPLRLVRAVRLATELGFSIDPATAAAIAVRADSAARPAAERLRDELLRLVAAPGTAQGVTAMYQLGLLQRILPELAECRSSPKRGTGARWGRDVLGHSLEVTAATETILTALAPTEREMRAREASDGAADVPPGGAAEVPEEYMALLRRYAGPLREHLYGSAMSGHPRAVHLELAALLHDIGRPACRSRRDPAGAIAEPGRTGTTPEAPPPMAAHADVGAERGEVLAYRLRLSRRETQYLTTLTRLHPRPLAMARADGATRAAVYDYFAAAGSSGVDVALLSLADNAVKRHMGQETVAAVADVVDRLLHAWFFERRTAVEPVPLLRGDEIMSELGLPPGPEIGRVLDALRRAQAEGRVNDRGGALELARREAGTS